jgi:GDP-L-fucose synthase
MMRTYVTGHRGLVGSAIVLQLQSRGDCEILTRTRAQLDLTDQAAVRWLFATEQIEIRSICLQKEHGNAF